MGLTPPSDLALGAPPFAIGVFILKATFISEFQFSPGFLTDFGSETGSEKRSAARFGISLSRFSFIFPTPLP